MRRTDRSRDSQSAADFGKPFLDFRCAQPTECVVVRLIGGTTIAIGERAPATAMIQSLPVRRDQESEFVPPEFSAPSNSTTRYKEGCRAIELLQEWLRVVKVVTIPVIKRYNDRIPRGRTRIEAFDQVQFESGHDLRQKSGIGPRTDGVCLTLSSSVCND